MANLFYQMYSAIENGFGDDGGIQKREIKFDDQQSTKDFVFSRSEFNRLKDAASDLSDWIKTSTHTDIKQVKDIDSFIIKECLISKHRENGGTCNSNTINTLEQSIDKISHLVDKKFGINTDWSVDHKELPQDNEKLRVLRMDPDHLKEALDSMKDGTAGKFGVEMAREFGLRASETVKIEVRDVDFGNHILSIIDSKGGKSRDLEMNSDQEAMIKERIAEKGLVNDKDRLVPIKEQSVSDLLCKGLKRAEHREYSDHKTSIHSVRKMWAQDKYESAISSYLDKGETFKEAEKHALSDVAVALGHGASRTTIESYVDRYDSQDDFEAAGH